MDDEKLLQATQTGEVVQPIRLYYQIVDKKRLLNRFKRLRCMDFDRVNNRWVWLYSHESKVLKFVKSYSSIPKVMHPIVIGSFFLRNGDESLFLDLRSFDRAIEAIPFFDKHIGRTVARITHAAVVNRYFEAKEQFPPNLDRFFCSDEMIEINPDDSIAEIESSIEKCRIDGKSDFHSVFEKRAKKALPEIEKFPVHFYEEGVESIKTVLRMRQIMAYQHWNGNTDCTLFDIIKTAAFGQKIKIGEPIGHSDTGI
jgi:hypothetical protein